MVWRPSGLRVVFIYIVPSLSSTSLCLHSLLTQNEKDRSSRVTHPPSQLSFVSSSFLSVQRFVLPGTGKSLPMLPLQCSFSLLFTIILNIHDIETSARVILPKMAFHFLLLSSFFFYCLFWFLFFSLPHCLVMTSINNPNPVLLRSSCNCVHFSPFAVFLRYDFYFAMSEVQKKPLDH